MVHESMAAMAPPVNRTGEVSMTPAFERLFMSEYARVVRIAQRVLEDPHEAEDVAQEVFVSFHRCHAPDVPYAAAWLHAAAAHTALNVVRGRRRRANRESRQAMADLRLTPTGLASDPLDLLEQGEQYRELRLALHRLPHKAATVLVLRYSGLSYAEVAAALGVKIGQVGTLLRRAEESLRKEMVRGSSH